MECPAELLIGMFYVEKGISEILGKQLIIFLVEKRSK